MVSGVQVGYVGEVLLGENTAEEMVQYLYHLLASTSPSSIFTHQLVDLGSGL